MEKQAYTKLMSLSKAASMNKEALKLPTQAIRSFVSMLRNYTKGMPSGRLVRDMKTGVETLKPFTFGDKIKRLGRIAAPKAAWRGAKKTLNLVPTKATFKGPVSQFAENSPTWHRFKNLQNYGGKANAAGTGVLKDTNPLGELQYQVGGAHTPGMSASTDSNLLKTLKDYGGQANQLGTGVLKDMPASTQEMLDTVSNGTGMKSRLKNMLLNKYTIGGTAGAGLFGAGALSRQGTVSDLRDKVNKYQSEGFWDMFMRWLKKYLVQV